MEEGRSNGGGRQWPMGWVATNGGHMVLMWWWYDEEVECGGGLGVEVMQ